MPIIQLVGLFWTVGESLGSVPLWQKQVTKGRLLKVRALFLDQLPISPWSGESLHPVSSTPPCLPWHGRLQPFETISQSKYAISSIISAWHYTLHDVTVTNTNITVRLLWAYSFKGSVVHRGREGMVGEYGVDILHIIMKVQSNGI